MERPVTRVLADYVAGATFEQLPKEVVDSTRRLILDDIGCALGGFTMSGGKILIGEREATIIGEGKKVSCILSAGVNAQLAGVLDFNENWKVGHVGSAIAEAGISVGEK